MKRKRSMVFDPVAAAGQRTADPSEDMEKRKCDYGIVQVKPCGKLPYPDIQIHEKKRTEKSPVKDHAGRGVVKAVYQLGSVMDIRNFVFDKIREPDQEKHHMTANKDACRTADTEISQMTLCQFCLPGNKKNDQYGQDKSYDSCNLIGIHGGIISHVL